MKYLFIGVDNTRIKQSPTRAILGGNVRIFCMGDNKLTWKFNNETIEQKNVAIKLDAISVRDIERKNFGTYLCKGYLTSYYNRFKAFLNFIAYGECIMIMHANSIL